MSLSPEEVIALAHHPASSRVLDVYLESQTVPFKAKRQLVMSIIGHFHILADDRIGSRVADRCWAFADPYLKARNTFCITVFDLTSVVFQEKIGRSLIPYENVLVASPYGKYFARNLNLYLLQRRPGEWKTMQAEKKRAALGHSVDSPAPSTVPTHFESSRRKRKRRKSLPEDEIDALFNMKITQGSQISEVAAFPGKVQRDVHQPFLKTTDSGLQNIFGAIRAAPKGERKEKKKGR
jgi:nucleolar protein 9